MKKYKTAKFDISLSTNMLIEYLNNTKYELVTIITIGTKAICIMKNPHG